MVNVNVSVKEYVKAHLSPSLIEKNTTKVGGQVDDQHFVFCLVARYRRMGRFVVRALKYKGKRCAPLNREAVGSQSLWRTEKISYSVPNSKKILSIPGYGPVIKINRGENVAMRGTKVIMN